MTEKLNYVLKALVDNLDEFDKDDLYRYLWFDYVKKDVNNYIIDNVENKDPEEWAEIIAKRIVYDGDYDCNITYWDNMKNILDSYDN